jgi:peptide/nickel transport system substrate-binding protein
MLYNGLLQYLLTEQSPDAKVKIVPDLAESYEISGDGKSYTFHLRKNVKWHDGVPFTSADVKFSLEVDAKYHPRGKTILGPILDKIETPDDYTVIVRLKVPSPALEWAFDIGNLPIATAKHVYENTDIPTNPANLNPIGTGPFRFVKWEKGKEIVFEKNPYYFKPGLPRVDKIVVRIIPDLAARVLALEKGEIHYIHYSFISKSELQRLENVKGVRVIRWGDQSGLVMMLCKINLNHPILSDVRVRQALAYAINRDELVSIAARGFATPAYIHMPSFSPLYPSDAPKYEYSPEKAKSLLSQAGYPNGFDLTITTFPGREEVAEVVRDQFTKVGINAKVEVLEEAAAVQKVYTEGKFDVFVTTMYFGPDPAIGMHRAYLSTQIGVMWANASRYKNPEVDNLLLAAATEMNFDKRKALYKEIFTILYRDVPVIPLLLWRQFGAEREEVSIVFSGYAGGGETYEYSRFLK